MSTCDSLVGLLEDGLLLKLSNFPVPYFVRAFVVEDVGNEAKVPASYCEAFLRIKGHVVWRQPSTEKMGHLRDPFIFLIV